LTPPSAGFGDGPFHGNSNFVPLSTRVARDPSAPSFRFSYATSFSGRVTPISMTTAGSSSPPYSPDKPTMGSWHVQPRTRYDPVREMLIVEGVNDGVVIL
jgi:hypothetical protein